MEISRLKILMPSTLMYIYAKESYAFIAQSIFFAVVFGLGGAVFWAEAVLVYLFPADGGEGLFYRRAIGRHQRYKEIPVYPVPAGQGHQIPSRQ
jgi:hypothetical protein